MDDKKQESKKTVVAFVAGLLIGGLLVWLFAGSPEGTTADKTSRTNTDVKATSAENEDAEAGDVKNEDADSTPTEQERDTGMFTVSDQPAGSIVSLGAVRYPSEEGWIVVHEDVNGELGSALGAARYQTGAGLMPQEVELLRDTQKGMTYHAVYYTEDGDKMFDLKVDTPMKKDGKLLEATFVAE